VHQYKVKTDNFTGLTRIHIPLATGISTSPSCRSQDVRFCQVHSSYVVGAVAETSEIITGLHRLNNHKTKWG
jgi:hypothetical protein